MRTLLIVLLLSLAAAPTLFAAPVHLSVAASLTDAANDLIATYRTSHSDAEFLPNFAASGSLARQVAQGAPADIYVAANPAWMTYLVEEGLIRAGDVRTLANNVLVFVGRKGLDVSSLQDLTALERIAIGSPRSVPAGQYAEQALKAAGLYRQLRGRLIMARDVRQALVYADRGEADGAFVYRTDALLARRAAVLVEVPQRLYDEVTYSAALTAAGGAKPEAAAFFAFLQSEVAGAILKKYGFVVKSAPAGAID